MSIKLGKDDKPLENLRVIIKNTDELVELNLALSRIGYNGVIPIAYYDGNNKTTKIKWSLTIFLNSSGTCDNYVAEHYIPATYYILHKLVSLGYLWERVHNITHIDDKKKVETLKIDISKGAKFKVDNQEQFELLRNYLIENGCLWGEIPLSTFRAFPQFIIASENHLGKWFLPCKEHYFESSHFYEYKITLESYREIVTGNSLVLSEVVPPVEIIEINGKKYNKAELIERLSTLKEV